MIIYKILLENLYNEMVKRLIYELNKILTFDDKIWIIKTFNIYRKTKQQKVVINKECGYKTNSNHNCDV